MAILDGDILRVSANFELGDGSLYQNIFHYIRDGTDPVSDAAHVDAIEARLQAAYAQIVDNVKNDVVEQLSFVDRVAWSGTFWEVTENIGTFTIVFTPIAAGDALPHQCAPFIIFKTLRPRTVGKKFLFPFAEAFQADSILVPAAVTDMAAFAAEIVASIPLGGDATLQAGVVRTGVDSWYNFLVAVVNDVIGTQRRRRPGVGA